MYNTSFTEEDVKNLSLYNIPTTTTVSSGSGTVDLSGVGTGSYVLKLPEASYGGYKDHINDLIVWYKFEKTPNGELRNYGKDSKYYGIVNNSGIAKPELVFEIPDVYTEERMYPPTRDLASSSHTISGADYGNGLYETEQSDETYHPDVIAFSAFNEDAISTTHGPHFNNTYDSGSFTGNSYIVADYLGEWVKIKLPVAIKLTKYGFKQRIPSYEARSPGQYKIYGSNNGTTWSELVYKTTTINSVSYTHLTLPTKA